MNLDQAIRLALEYEASVHQIYREAMEKTADKSAKRIFEVLCAEERQHLAYLQDCLEEWQRMGRIQVKNLETAIPAPEVIERSLRDIGQTLKARPSRRKHELELLKKALAAEIQTGNFYSDVARQLDAEGQEVFKRFVEIEKGHTAIVQAEIDSMNKWGFWFDTPEFRLENE